MLFEAVNRNVNSGNSVKNKSEKHSYSYLNFKTVLTEKEKKESRYDTYCSSNQDDREAVMSGNYNRNGDFNNSSNNTVKDNIKRQWSVTEEPKRENYTTKEEYYNAMKSYRDYVEDRIKNGPEKFQIGALEVSLEDWEKLLKKVDTAIDEIKQSIKEDIEHLEEERENMDIQEDQELKDLKVNSLLADRIKGDFGAPYSYLADENGIITYKGVVFVCDNEKNQLCLGDMSDPNKVLNIPLSKGGCLRVNRDNYGDLAKAITMFSPEDINIIMRAITMDKRAQQMKNEIDDMKSKPVDESAVDKLIIEDD